MASGSLRAPRLLADSPPGPAKAPAPAFSVLVEGGGVGGRVAAPQAATFLAAAP